MFNRLGFGGFRVNLFISYWGWVFLGVVCVYGMRKGYGVRCWFVCRG